MAAEPDLPLVSLDRFTTVTGGDPDFERELIEIFEDDVSAQLERLEAACANQALEDLALVAHRLKGACGNIGAARLQWRAQAIEQHARNGTVADATDQIAAFRREFHDTIRCFRT